jgi:hypothetical protein
MQAALQYEQCHRQSVQAVLTMAIIPNQVVVVKPVYDVLAAMLAE